MAKVNNREDAMLFSQSNRLWGLDGLRAISALMIVFCHLHTEELPIPSGLKSALWYGNFGVEIFFVISGFIITHIILREEVSTDRFNIKQFYIRRAIRILPPAYFYLVVVSVLCLWRNCISQDEVLASAFFFRNIFRAGSHYTAHFWSLSIEEQFYLCWPITMFFLPKSWRLRFCLILLVFAPIWRQVNFIVSGGAMNVNSWRADLRYDALLTGVLLALLWSKQPIQIWLLRRLQLAGWLFIALTLLLIGSFLLPKTLPAGLNILVIPSRYWCVAGIILILISRRSTIVNSVFNWKPLVWTGKVSYSLYLWQQLATISPFAGGWWGVAVAFFLSFSFAAFSYYFIEQPMSKLRGRLFTEQLIPITSGAATL